MTPPAAPRPCNSQGSPEELSCIAIDATTVTRDSLIAQGVKPAAADELVAYADRLLARGALAKYARHSDDCAWRRNDPAGCNCGLAKVESTLDARALRPVSPEAAPPRCAECGGTESAHPTVHQSAVGGSNWTCVEFRTRPLAWSPSPPEAAPPRATTPEPMPCIGCLHPTHDRGLCAAEDDVGTPCECEWGTDRYAFDLQAMREAFALGNEDAAMQVVREHFAAQAAVRASLAPSRESGALLERALDARALAAMDQTDRAYASADRARAALDRHLSTLERDAARMREALAEYIPWAQHLDHCASVTSNHWKKCDCGLAALRAALSPSGEPTATPETSG